MRLVVDQVKVAKVVGGGKMMKLKNVVYMNMDRGYSAYTKSAAI